MSQSKSEQLTTAKTCKEKVSYWSGITAKRAVQRRNKTAGYKYLRKYKCNVCEMWHVTTQMKVEGKDEN